MIAKGCYCVFEICPRPARLPLLYALMHGPSGLLVASRELGHVELPEAERQADEKDEEGEVRGARLPRHELVLAEDLVLLDPVVLLHLQVLRRAGKVGRKGVRLWWW